MSMKSKVSTDLRQTILIQLSSGTSMSNRAIASGNILSPSLRATQEATQKMTRENVLVRTGRGFYKLNTTVPQAIGATA